MVTNRKKDEFILDCYNIRKIGIPIYNDLNDKYLANFFNKQSVKKCIKVLERSKQKENVIIMKKYRMN